MDNHIRHRALGLGARSGVLEGRKQCSEIWKLKLCSVIWKLKLCSVSCLLLVVRDDHLNLTQLLPWIVNPSFRRETRFLILPHPQIWRVFVWFFNIVFIDENWVFHRNFDAHLGPPIWTHFCANVTKWAAPNVHILLRACSPRLLHACSAPAPCLLCSLACLPNKQTNK